MPRTSLALSKHKKPPGTIEHVPGSIQGDPKLITAQMQANNADSTQIKHLKMPHPMKMHREAPQSAQETLAAASSVTARAGRHPVPGQVRPAPEAAHLNKTKYYG